MLRALNRVAERLRKENELPPVSYKSRVPKSNAPIRIIELSSVEPAVSEPFKKAGSLSQIFAPDRQRSGNAPEPYLLLDMAEYVFGITKKRKSGDSKELHSKYIALLQEAYKVTGEQSLGQILTYIQQTDKKPPAYLNGIEPNEFIAIRTEKSQFPFELPSVQRFWSEYLAEELKAKHPAQCLICGDEKQIIRIMNREIVVMGQKCQVSSFKLPAFRSYGKGQTTNAPLCFDCASTAIDALDYLSNLRNRHTAVLSRDDTKSKTKNPLRNQLAVYWMTKIPPQSDSNNEIDIEQALAMPIQESKPGAPPPDLKQLEDLLKVPFTARDASLLLDDESFCLAVLSANKGRLVVREWLEVQLEKIRTNLKTFLDASRIIDSFGESIWPHSISFLLRPFNIDEKVYPKKRKPLNNSPNLRRGLLRTAYLGYLPPHELLGLALTRLHVLWAKGEEDNPKREEERIWQIQALIAGIKLVLTYGKEAVNMMVKLDEDYEGVPYLCGRLLAIIGECQWRASKVHSIAERFYPAVATAPAVYLSMLFDRTNSAYLPKIRREKKGYGELSELINKITGLIEPRGGFPVSMTLDQKAEFALGFYHQRAKITEDNNKRRKEKEAQNVSN